LNDNSDDKTGEILHQFQSEKVTVVEGKLLPEGWIGKSWACYQLSQIATGDLLLFTDADTVFKPETISNAVNAIVTTDADLITAVNKNQVKTLGEQITVPFIVWSIFTILPLAISYLFPRTKSLSAANGKFMLFSRAAYERIGGHQAVRSDAAEDLALSRLVKGARMKWLLIDLTELVSTRMYHGFLSAWRGFSKNFFAIFDYRVLPALFVWFWMLLITYHPLVTAAVLIGNGQLNAHFQAAAATVALSLLIWFITALKTKLPVTVVLLYPLTMAVASSIGIYSLILSVLGRTGWKGRRLPRHRIRIV
ncbi:MAG: glycosyltransferase, partial [candidate division WOR-3 bacterium]